MCTCLYTCREWESDTSFALKEYSRSQKLHFKLLVLRYTLFSNSVRIYLQSSYFHNGAMCKTELEKKRLWRGRMGESLIK